MTTHHAAKMTDDHYTLLQRFWRGTDYLAERQIQRIQKRVDVIQELKESAKKAVTA